MAVEKRQFYWRGQPALLDSITVDERILYVTGTTFRIAKVERNLPVDVPDAEAVIRALKSSGIRADLFVFLESIGEERPRYDYFSLPTSRSILPLKTYEHWWNDQISKSFRRYVKKSHKMGVDVRPVEFSDELVSGIMEIFNETPIRQGKPFWHYGKDFETVKQDVSLDAEISEFIGAYHNEQLIGFIKFLNGEKVGDPVLWLSMTKHQDKAPNNALIAKLVEIATEKNVSFLDYGEWRSGGHRDFLRRCGFEKHDIPKYFVPLTLKGKLFLKLGLHRGPTGLLPEGLRDRLKGLRRRFYTWKHPQ